MTVSTPIVKENSDLCTGCGLCVSDCLPKAMKIIGAAAQSGDGCFFCGHCVSICPEGAVSLEGEKDCTCLSIGYPDVSYQRTAPRKEADIRWL